MCYLCEVAKQLKARTVNRDRENLKTKTGMDKHVDLLHTDFKIHQPNKLYFSWHAIR